MNAAHKQERAAAERALAALAEAEAAVNQLNAARTLIRMAGGAVPSIAVGKLLQPLRQYLRVVTGEPS